MKQKKHHGWLIILGVCILAVILAVILLFETEDEQEKTKIGFVLSGSTMENGWNGMHYNGIQEACRELDLELLVRENIIWSNLFQVFTNTDDQCSCST